MDILMQSYLSGDCWGYDAMDVTVTYLLDPSGATTIPAPARFFRLRGTER